MNGPDRGTDPRRSRRGADPWPEGPCGLGDEGFAESGEVGVTLDPAELERTYNPMRQNEWTVFSSGNTSDRYYDWDHVAVEFDYGQGYDFVAQNSIDEKEQWNKFYWAGTDPMQRMNMRNVGYRLISANSSVGGRY